MDSDDQRLTELFRAASADAPPATFSHAEVIATSARKTAARHRLVGASAAVGLLIVVGAALFGLGVLPGTARTSSDTANAAGNAAAPRAGPDPAGDQAAVPAPEKASGAPGCAEPDAELAAGLAAVLPAAAGAVPEPVPPSACTPGARGVQLAVSDGANRGVIRVVLNAGDASTPLPPGSASAGARTAAGQSLVIAAIPSGSPPAPFADELPDLARRLATRL